MEFSYNINNEKPSESCGVVGIYSSDQDISRLIYLGIYSLQHRGQESAGIACSDGEKISLHKNLGLVNQVFKEENLNKLKGNSLFCLNAFFCTTTSCKHPLHLLVVEHNREHASSIRDIDKFFL